MIVTTKFNKIGMFKRFTYLGTQCIKVGRNLYTNDVVPTNCVIPTLSTPVVQVDEKYQWSPSPDITPP